MQIGITFYQSIVKNLLYISPRTCLNIVHTVMQLCYCMFKPAEVFLVAAKRVLRNVIGNPAHQPYFSLSSSDPTTKMLTGYPDANLVDNLNTCQFSGASFDFLMEVLLPGY